MNERQKFFAELAHSLANDLMIYRLKAATDPSYRILSPNQIFQMELALQDLRENAGLLDQDEIDTNMSSALIARRA